MTLALPFMLRPVPQSLTYIQQNKLFLENFYDSTIVCMNYHDIETMLTSALASK